MQFSLSDLRLFIAVAEQRNLTRAADRCHLSLPAVSKRIQAIEEQARCRLFEREARGVRLTSAGEAFARHARAMLLEAESLNIELDSFAQGQQGHLTILANTTAVTEFMPAVLAGFLSAHPHLSVSIRELPNHEIARCVREGRCNLGVVAGDLDLSGMIALPFTWDRLVVVAPRGHELVQNGPVAFANVIEHPCVGLREDSTISQFLARRVEAMGQPPLRPRVEVHDFEALCMMVEAGVGVGFIPETAARRHGERLDIGWVALTDGWAGSERSLVMRKGDAVPRYLKELVAAVFAHHGRVAPAAWQVDMTIDMPIVLAK